MSEWISVKDKLPEEFENVIAFNRRGRGKACDMDICWWNGYSFDRCGKRPYSNVTHWMPLPEPPKEADE